MYHYGEGSQYGGYGGGSRYGGGSQYGGYGPYGGGPNFAYEGPTELLALGTSTGRIAIFNLADNAVVAQHQIAGGHRIGDVKFSNDGQRVYATNDRCLYEFDTEDLTQRAIFQDRGRVLDFSLSLDGQALYTCSSRAIRIWDSSSRFPAAVADTWNAPRQLNCMDIIPTKNVLVTGDSSGFVMSWNLGNRAQGQDNDFASTGIKTISACSTGNYICAATDESIYEYNFVGAIPELTHEEPMASVGEEVVKLTFPIHNSRAAACAFSSSIGEYVPTQKKVEWTRNISAHVNDSQIVSLAVTPVPSRFFTGNARFYTSEF